MPRVGDWMQTFTGGQFWPLDPRPEDVRIEDIAHALALENRFAGHTAEPYSVAQHSVLVRLLAGETTTDPDVLLWALLHDAAEAYLKDIPRPLKRGLGDAYKIPEAFVENCIATAFGLPTAMPALVHHCDERALATERRDVFPAGSGRVWTLRAEPASFKLSPVPWYTAEAMFLEEYGRLQIQRATRATP